MIPCALGGFPPGAEGLEHDGTWYLYHWNNIRKLLSSAMKMRIYFPADSFGNAAYQCMR